MFCSPAWKEIELEIKVEIPKRFTSKVRIIQTFHRSNKNRLGPALEMICIHSLRFIFVQHTVYKTMQHNFQR